MGGSAEAARRRTAKVVEERQATKRKADEEKETERKCLKAHAPSTAQKMLEKCLLEVKEASAEGRRETCFRLANSGSWDILNSRREYHAMDKLAALLKREGFEATVVETSDTYCRDKDYPSYTDYFILVTIKW